MNSKAWSPIWRRRSITWPKSWRTRMPTPLKPRKCTRRLLGPQNRAPWLRFAPGGGNPQRLPAEIAARRTFDRYGPTPDVAAIKATESATTAFMAKVDQVMVAKQSRTLMRCARRASPTLNYSDSSRRPDVADDRDDVPSAVPPAPESYQIPGGLLAAKEARKADAASRRPMAEYARGSFEDRSGNRLR